MKMNMSTLQKEQMEDLYNLYNRQYYLCESDRERALGGMAALKHVASIFGCRFESSSVETVSGKTVSVYRLEEI